MAGAKKKKPSTRKGITQQPRIARSRPLLGIFLLIVGLLGLVAIGDFDLAQSSDVSTDPSDVNLVGFIGAKFAYRSFQVIGIAAWLLPVYLIWSGVLGFFSGGPRSRLPMCFLILFALLSASGLGSLLEADGLLQSQGGLFERQLASGVGGIAGGFLAGGFIKPLIGPFGAYTLFLVGFFAAPLYLGASRWLPSLASLKEHWKSFLQKRAENRAERRRLKAEKKLGKREENKVRKQSRKAKKEAEVLARSVEEVADEIDEEWMEGEEKPSLLRRMDSPPPGLNREVKKLTRKRPAPVTPTEQAAPPKVIAEKPKLDPATIKIVSGVKTEKATAAIPEQRGDYKFPPIKLLSEAPDASGAMPEDHASTMEALVRTLDEFGVKVIPGEIHTGPVITRYEVTPAPGVRVEKIVNLDKNIALGLRALSVRILAPVPGKGTVGIEVPNQISQPVCMRDIVESKAWADAKADIPVVLGKDVTGTPMVTDLTKMPHVLIAGSTGSGKTVCINAIIASLLYHAGPEDIRFIMVDPKVVEMQVYNALPHMLIPVVTEPKKVPGALKWLLAEMERRYQIFAKENVRNIAGFNAKLAKTKEEKEKAAAMDAEMTAEERAAVSQIEVPRDDDAFEVPRKKLPYIVCIIDELADLMMVAPADIETGIARLAQLARAAGIHLILATQRPSVNVITGVIKANLPSRISFKVASKVDSRTILDGGGAEALIGKGDMLFIPPGTSNLVRAQGAFVSDDEINGIVDYLKENNEPPNFAEEIQNQINSSDEEGGSSSSIGGEDGDDALLGGAIDVLRSTKRASTSMLQRRLRIGYNRAARLMEELEERGIVGPENGSSPREILVDLDVM
ncbi:MAG: DNA translocase FtsK 4TM domain-containing protein [Coraliomargaritaceae bacterium]